MAKDPPATALSRRAKALVDRVRGRRRTVGAEVSDLQWAPPYEPDETVPYVRTPEPWPPLPPPDPTGGAASVNVPTPPVRPAVPGRSGANRRAVAIGATVIVVAGWVGVAVFRSPAHTAAPTTGDIASATGNADAPVPSPASTGRRATIGVVQFVNGDTLTLLDGNGQSIAVHTGDSTRFTKTVPVGVGRLAAGDTIVAYGVYSEASASFVAGRITIVSETGAAQGFGRSFTGGEGDSASGTVTAIAGTELTLNGSDGRVLTVDVAPTATVMAPAVGSIGDMAPGKPIAVRGAVADNGDIDAYQIQEGAIGSPVGVGPEPLHGTGSLGLTPGPATQP